jgi:hypothetical protein
LQPAFAVFGRGSLPDAAERFVQRGAGVEVDAQAGNGEVFEVNMGIDQTGGDATAVQVNTLGDAGQAARSSSLPTARILPSRMATAVAVGWAGSMV